MDREIKFRAYRKHGYDKGYDEPFAYSDSVAREADALSIFFCVCDTQQLEYDQYTGLKDKNGKEIYEGDIISNGKHSMDVKFKDIYHQANECWHSVGFSVFDGINEDGKPTFEIIGNIYENQELLEDKS
jgi:uncharacterized phage protein (TIGR01671 family)